jgi:exopolysaccharide biosynthesis protein
MTLEELAALLTALGASTALNLDGGGSTSLVTRGRLVNQPRKDFEVPEPAGRPVSTALLFLAR